MSSPLELARDLEARDASLARAAGELEALNRDVADLRARAAEIESFRERLPHERAALEAALERAETDIAAREGQAHEAEARLAAAGSSEDERAARRDVVATRDALSTARAARDDVAGQRDRLEREARSMEDSVTPLEQRAAGTARRVDEALHQDGSRPEALEDIEPWGARARSSLFVARATTQRQREAILREASELAASALGEPAAATSAELARKRIERAQRN
jgi:chromosome segregation ATPase